MLCKKPFMAGAVPFGCGQCLPCRINRARVWTWRQYLESLAHEQNSFVTLTYDPLHIPGNWTLVPLHLTQFIRELRRAYAPLRFRYYAVGEYGTKTRRPHYHLSVFGLSQFSRVGNEAFGDSVSRIWGKGYTSCFEFNQHTAQYVGGYITKKLEDRKDGLIWNYPEFARMSNRPGIGAPALATLGRNLSSVYQTWESGDVPAQLSLGRRKIPLGRYLLRKLRTELGFTDEYIKELRDQTTMETTTALQGLSLTTENFISLKETYLASIEGRLNQVDSRYYQFKRKDNL